MNRIKRTYYLSLCLLLASLLLLSGCALFQSSNTSSSTEEESEEKSEDKHMITISQLISLQGIGPYKLGEKITETLKKAQVQRLIAKGVMHSDGGLMVGLYQGKNEVLAFSTSPEDRLTERHHARKISDKLFSPDDKISLLYTDNPSFKTAEGIGPKSNLSDAEKVYGKVSIIGGTYLYAKFKNHPKDDRCIIEFKVDGATVRKARYQRNQIGSLPDGFEISAVEVYCH